MQRSQYVVATFDSDADAAKWMNERSTEGYGFVSLSSYGYCSSHGYSTRGKTIIMERGV